MMNLDQNPELLEALENAKQSEAFVLRFNSSEFFFQRAVDFLNDFEHYPIDAIVNEIRNLTYEIQRDSTNGFSYQALIDNSNNHEVKNLLILLGRLISVLDTHGYNKKEWNPYDDKRAIASAGVRQNDWTLSLLLYKLSNSDISSINNTRYASVAYTIQ